VIEKKRNVTWTGLAISADYAHHDNNHQHKKISMTTRYTIISQQFTPGPIKAHYKSDPLSGPEKGPRNQPS
jgi:hypothetical protein